MEKKRLSKRESVKSERNEAETSTSTEPAAATEFHNWELTNKKTTEFRWIIKNFTSCLSGAVKQLDSPVFPTTDRPQWRLQLCPLGDNEESNEFVSLVIVLVSSKASSVEAQVKFSILDSKGKKSNDMMFTDTLVKNGRVGYSKFIKRSVLTARDKGLLTNDTLTIVCEITTTSSTSNLTSVVEPVPAIEYPTEDLGHLLENKTFCDLFVFVDGIRFPAHKLILAARSPFMANMFQQQMEKEDTGDSVTLTDIDQETFGAVLRFIYTGKVDGVEDMTDKLLIASSKFQVEHLRVLCEEEISKKLTTENVIKYLILADLHSADQLRNVTFEFINRNAVDIIRKDDWQELIKSHPHLVAEMYVRSIEMF